MLSNRTCDVNGDRDLECGIDRGFQPRSGQTKDNTNDIYCFSAKHASLNSKSKD